MVRKLGPNEWGVLSEKGKILSRGYKSKKAAKERLRQIEAAKHAKRRKK